jgi:hypothetical protein
MGMRRRKLLVALAGLAVVVAAWAIVLWPRAMPTSLVTKENCARIQLGMRRAEVEVILGPAGDYSTDPRWASDWPAPGRPDSARWLSDRGAIYVCFDASGGVTKANYWDNLALPPSPLRDLLVPVERQWRRWFPE